MKKEKISVVNKGINPAAQKPGIFLGKVVQPDGKVSHTISGNISPVEALGMLEYAKEYYLRKLFDGKKD